MPNASNMTAAKPITSKLTAAKLTAAKWNYPTTVLFGAGRVRELPTVLSSRGLKRPLVVVDDALATLPMTMEVVEMLRLSDAVPSVFSNFKGNPVGANVEEGVMAFHAGGHDSVIAFGGGSAMDVAKAVAFMAIQDRPLWDFEDIGDNYLRAKAAAPVPVIAVPTTAGTGSEVGRASVITNEATHKKTIIFHPTMMPVTVILDPELTVPLPPWLTAATGMDALAHSLEAYSAPGFHPMADGIAAEGIRLIHQNLLRAYQDGSDLEARGNMLVAASMGAAAFQKGLGAIHSLSHPVGALFNTHHGMTNAVFMPYVMLFNRDAIEERMSRLAGYLGLAEQSFDAMLAWVLELRHQLGIPHTLRELGVDEAKMDELVELAIADPSCGGNPVELTRENLRQLFSWSLAGNLEFRASKSVEPVSLL